MKKQNPTNKLVFTKLAVAELNDTQLLDVKGGVTTLPTIIITFFPDDLV
ncbi:class I lanthipeptide [Flavobacterium sp. Fl-318]|uniref:Class I lanthipeptide n=1 Tax=Flavobacterium cupriresistens TaxID=2893885 RepID=A0ABU4RKZ0_9FLAO|nr:MULTISPECIES: class I lanthipeptide [unclassified Flavobacterium]MDX6192130.1 class I lanthipeptide [Flavobacterium sp. Fl-318]UFH43735.1 class I lanthipeptide [Flavobacterium sp. F-323]